MSTLDAALRYNALGWSVIPVQAGNKKPAVPSWKEYQSVSADEGQLKVWFGEGNHNIAVVLGPVSGGLYCRDFDELAAYEAWADRYPDHAATLSTVETPRPGRHVYIRTEAHLGVSKLGDGEFRGSGSYVLVPPSTNGNGRKYRQLIPFGETIPIVDPASCGLLRSFSERATESTETTERTESPERTEQTEHENCSVLSVASTREIEKAIRETLPGGPGRRNRQVFALARSLKAVPVLADADANACEPYVREWHARALQHVHTKPFEETWIDFLTAWPRVKYPKGEEPMAGMFAAALKAGVPPEATRYEQPAIHHLAALCRELQRGAGTQPFFLSARTAGRLLEVDHTTAWRWLFLLQNDRVIEVVERGEAGKQRATRFRYLGEL